MNENKNSNQLKIFLAVVLAFTISLLNKAEAQKHSVINNIKTYRSTIKKDSSYRIIELHSLIPNLVYDLKYATPDNFTKKQLYKNRTLTFLRLPAARALLKVQQRLNSNGHGLKIFDAYRPYNVTQEMWNLIQDERYVANPLKGSGHNRGLAVDVTIIDLKTGAELDMGTAFDNFTDSAHSTFKNLPTSVLQNRNLLKQTMEEYGFKLLETEWWHFSWPNDKNYEVLNLSFKQLYKASY